MTTKRVNGIRLRFKVEGREWGEPVLLSNSLASSLAMWDEQVERLVDAGYRVVRYDSRGHGGSDAPVGDYDLATLAADAIGLLDALEIDRVHFCGLSKGGMVGQWVGTHFGDRLRSLTLCDTAAQMAPPEMWDQRIAMAREGGMEAVVDATIERWFTEAGRARMPEAIAAVRGMILATPVDGFCGCCAAIREMDQRESIRSITTPTQLIVGEADPSTPVAAAELIAGRIAGAKLAVIPQAAHMCNIEQPEAFDEALLGFLAEHRKPRW